MKCTSCGSPDLQFLPGNYARCNSCGNTLAEIPGATGQYAPPPPGYAPPGYAPAPGPQAFVPPPMPPMWQPPRKSSAAPLLIGVAVAVALLLAVAAAAMVLGVAQAPVPATGYLPTTPPRVSTGSGPPPADVPLSEENVERPSVMEKPAPQPKGEFRDVRQASVGGNLLWVGKYVNTGDTVIVDPSVTVSLFEAGGKRVAEQPGFAQRKWLEPGEWTLLMVLVAEAPEYARHEIKVNKPRAPSYETKPVKLTVTEWGMRRQWNSNYAVGTVRNSSGKSVKWAQVIVYGFDGQGQPVSVCDSYVTEKDLEPGAESGFSVMITTLAVGTAERYEVLAFASPD
ncbi:MAG: hypothetical protein DCC64_11580 [Planctomycetota bacterium]|nr:MAG: hypothetical protein DCC64_11580 [Planctomycetota bacterium]